MRALDAGSATGEIARKYQLSPKLLERWRGEWRAKGELAFPEVGRRGSDLGGKSQGFGDAVWSTEVAFSLLNCGMLFKEQKWDREPEFRIVVMGGDDVKPFSVKGCPRVALPLDRGAIVGVVRGPNAGSHLRAECMGTLLQECGYAGNLPIRDAISG